MSRFKETSTGNVYDVPDALDGMYSTRPGVVRYDETEQALEAAVDPAVTAPAGSTGAPVPTYDPEDPLRAGVQVFLENIGDATKPTLDKVLDVLGLPKSGTNDEKRDVITDALTANSEEATRG